MADKLKELSDIVSSMAKIRRERQNLNRSEKTLARRFVNKCSDMSGKEFFKTMYRIFGAYQTVRWYNIVFYDGKNIVKARKEVQSLLGK